MGDKIVYPMHGAGVIESIEERGYYNRTKTSFQSSAGT
ncbi:MULTISPECIES: CarD family transcriptional regulator [Aneurinibacillus]